MPLWTQMGNPMREEASRPGAWHRETWREGKISLKTGFIFKIWPHFAI